MNTREIWKTLDKDDKQKVFLTCLLVVFGLVAEYMFLLQPGCNNLMRSRYELSQSKQAVVDARDMIADQERIARIAAQSAKKFDQVRIWVPERVDTSWILNLVSEVARDLDIETGAIRPIEEDEDQPQSGFFRTATIQIEAMTDYHSLGRFVDELERRSPYNVIKDLSVQPSEENPAKQWVSFKIQYFMFRKTTAAPVSG